MNIFRKIVTFRNKEDEKFYYDLKRLLRFSPVKLNNYKKAFTHRSLKMLDNKGKPINYERLEFLGDAMLSAVIAAYLYKKAPRGDEGYLTKMRSKIVSRSHLNRLGKELELIKYVKSGVSQKNVGDNIHGNIFEALIGAIYLDRGYGYCHKFIYDKVIKPHVNLNSLENKITSHKGLIIEWCQKEKKRYNFESYEDTGVESQKHFSSKVFIDGKLIAKGRGTSKKKAEEMASKRVYHAFKKQIKR